jgi:hypothetical protein
LVKSREGDGGDFDLVFWDDLVGVVFFNIIHTTYLVMNDDNQKELLKDEKKDFVIPELATVGILGIIGQTLVSFVAWVVFECCWNRIKAWWQKKEK